MKFKNLKTFASELEKITGDKWWIDTSAYANNENLTRIENSIFSDIECQLEDFGGLSQNKILSLKDFKYYIKTSERNLKYVKLVQEAILYHHNKQTNKTHFECLIRREITFDTKLDDGSLLIDNLDDFQWQFEWKKGYSSGFHYIPSHATVSIQATPTNKVMEFLENKTLTEKEIIPSTHHSNIYAWLKNLTKQALSNINDNRSESKKSVPDRNIKKHIL